VTCRQCGLDVPSDARFCPSCGAPVAPEGADERRVVTVLFADIVGFTMLSETLDPEYVKGLVDTWFERLVGDITDFGGRVDKIVGDGILALFGAPVAHEDDAERAVRCGLRMQESLAAMAARSARDAPRVQMRIGVNTGEVLVGALRADGATTAMGDVVNTASRLQTAARPGEVLVGPATHALTAHALTYEHRGLLTARGRDAPVEVWSATGALVPPGQRPTRDQAPLVGRHRELGLIDAAVAAALGRPRALVSLLVGDTGVGKTRLAREAASRVAAGRDVLVLEGRCVPYGEANVWWPLAEALHGLCEVDPGDDLSEVRAAVWARVAAGLGDEVTDAELDRVTRGLLLLMGHTVAPGDTEPARARQAAVDAFVEFVEAHARRRPVLLLLSDVHWADDDLFALLGRLAERLARSRLVVIATARQTIRERWTPSVGRSDTLTINLGPLDPEASRDLLEELHRGPLPAELRDDLLARSGGNPFFLEELVALVDSTTTGRGARPAGPGGAAGGAGAVTAAGSPRVALPDTLRGIVAARLDALDPDERAVLTDAAVIGRRAPVSALHEMVDTLHRRVDFEAVVARLVEAELLELDRGYWEFRSEIAREVAYRTLPKAERAKRHAGIAAWLELRALTAAGLEPDRLPSDDALVGVSAIDDATVNRTAHHWAAASELVREMGPVDKVPADSAVRAVVWLAAAARRAQRRDLLPAAARAYDRALDLATPVGEPVADREGGRSDDLAAGVAAGGVAAGDPADDMEARRRRLLVSRARVRTERWDLDGARDDAETALALATAVGDRTIEAAAIVRLGDIDHRRGDLSAALRRLRAAADRFAAEGDARGEGEALRLLGLTQVFAGDPRSAMLTFEEAEVALAGTGDDADLGWVAQNKAWAALLVGELDHTESEVERSTLLFQRAGDVVGASWAAGLLAFVRFAQGRVDEAEALASRILEEADGHGDRWAAAMMRSLIASIRLWAGRVDEALALSTEATQGFRELGDPWGLVIALGTNGRALAMAGHVEDGFAVLADCRPKRTDGGGATGVEGPEMAMVALAVQIGEPERVASILGRAAEASIGTLGTEERDATLALAALQRGEVAGPVPSTDRAFGAAIAALVLAARGDVEAAIRTADAASGADDATYLDRITADVAAGLALARSDRPDDALARLDRARDAAAATSDRIAPAVVALARAIVAGASGATDPVEERTEAAVALARLGLSATGWETAFCLAAGVRPPQPVS